MSRPAAVRATLISHALPSILLAAVLAAGALAGLSHAILGG